MFTSTFQLTTLCWLRTGPDPKRSFKTNRRSNLTPTRQNVIKVKIRGKRCKTTRLQHCRVHHLRISSSPLSFSLQSANDATAALDRDAFPPEVTVRAIVHHISFEPLNRMNSTSDAVGNKRNVNMKSYPHCFTLHLLIPAPFASSAIHFACLVVFGNISSWSAWTEAHMWLRRRANILFCVTHK